MVPYSDLTDNENAPLRNAEVRDLIEFGIIPVRNRFCHFNSIIHHFKN